MSSDLPDGLVLASTRKLRQRFLQKKILDRRLDLPTWDLPSAPGNLPRNSLQELEIALEIFLRAQTRYRCQPLFQCVVRSLGPFSFKGEGRCEGSKESRQK